MYRETHSLIILRRNTIVYRSLVDKAFFYSKYGDNIQVRNERKNNLAISKNV